MVSDSPQAVAGRALSIVGSVALLGSTVLRWFSVLEEYPTDQVLKDYGVFASGGRIAMHSYIALGWSFEVLTVIAGLVALLATAYGSAVADRAKSAAVVVAACGVVALVVVVVASLAFGIANPPDDLALGSDLRLAPGAIAAALSGVCMLAGGLLTRRAVITAARRRTPDPDGLEWIPMRAVSLQRRPP